MNSFGYCITLKTTYLLLIIYFMINLTILKKDKQYDAILYDSFGLHVL